MDEVLVRGGSEIPTWHTREAVSVLDYCKYSFLKRLPPKPENDVTKRLRLPDYSWAGQYNAESKRLVMAICALKVPYNSDSPVLRCE